MLGNGMCFIEECARPFDLGSVQDVQQFHSSEASDQPFRVRTSSGDWFLELFDAQSVGSEDVRFIASYAAKLSTRGLTPALRSCPDGYPLARVTLEGQTYHVLCRPWIRGEARGPDGWSQQYLRQVGEFLAEMHSATSGWRPDLSRAAFDFSMSAEKAVERVESWDLVPPEQVAFLHGVAARISEELAELDAADQTVIHGDPWHGNLLLCDGHLKAIDLRTCGFGPCVGDIAVWFYWAMISFGPGGWRQPFDAVLSAYESKTALHDCEKSVVRHLACLRHLWFLVAEVEATMNAAPEDREAINFYVQDHVSAIRTIDCLEVLDP